MATGGTVFRELLAASRLVVAPGVYDAITAKLAETAGFDALYMTGAGVSASHGFPDFGLITLPEMARTAERIVRSSATPLIADADTGYGNELNVTRTVQDYIGAGVAALHIEDQVAPKRCGHLAGKEVISGDEFTSKIRAAANARGVSDLVIIARTDARAVNGLDDAIQRANAALAAGADMAFVEAVETLEEIAAVPRLVNGPCLLNIVPGGKSPAISMRGAESMGYRVAIHPGLALFTIVEHVGDEMRRMHETGISPMPRSPQPATLFELVGASRWNAIRDAAAESL